MNNFLFLPPIIFLFGILCLVTKNNFLMFLISLELLFLSANMNFILFSVSMDSFFGQVASLFLLTVAAAESAIGLALLLSLYRLRGSISVDQAMLKG